MQRAGTAEVAGAQAVLDNAKLNQGWNRSAPISGIAGIAKVGIGDLMTPNSVMATVSSVDPIYVDFSITRNYLRFVRDKTGRNAGRDLELVLSNGIVFPHRGKTLLVNRAVDLQNGTIQVRAEFGIRATSFVRASTRDSYCHQAQERIARSSACGHRVTGHLSGGCVGSDNNVTIKMVKLAAIRRHVDCGLRTGSRRQRRCRWSTAPARRHDRRPNAL